MTATDINQLSDTAQDLITIADEIKKRLSRYKDSFSDYKENTEIMDMIFNLGMNNDDDDFFIQKSSSSLSKKDFKTKIAQDLVAFLDSNIASYGGWIPCAELYWKFNRMLGMDLISPEKFIQACSHIEKLESDDGSFYTYKKDFKAKNGKIVAMITHQDFSISKKSRELEKATKKASAGKTVNDVIKALNMSYVVVDQVIEKAIQDGRIAVDEQDPAGKRYYWNKIGGGKTTAEGYDVEDIMI